ncbi:MAG: rRNA pseudouridine synthase [Verrucomicrobiota bacterium]|nr:rRNA pseudouridine synthase [Chthoniobacterales bacterium]MBA3762134.1 rRNA pseudouridine synthase [Chthoniobacterales bacterium]MDQ3313808.1 rRNA pseudouridine synthase [Verrucomicrobiota bacterium]
MRLNRYLAAAGVGSRRHCDELIAAGRVTINGRVCTDFAYQPAGTDHVKLGAKMLRAQRRLDILLHKPAGFVSTRTDPNARDTIFDLLPANMPRLFNVGRLDAQSEGLLVLTNDGDLAQRLTHPRYKVDKEYEVTLDRAWDAAQAAKLLHGVMLDGQRAKLERVYSTKPLQVRVVLRQGINRQIRRMFYEIGYEVKRLVRIRVGTLRLGELPRGHWRPLTKAELNSLDPAASRLPAERRSAHARSARS